MDKQQEVDDLSDWLDDANRTVFAEAEWDDTVEIQVSDEWVTHHDIYAGISWREPKDKTDDVYAEDDIEVIADSEGLRSWRHDTGQWRVIT